MSAVTMHHTTPATGSRVAHLVDTVRWAPAPRFEGDAAHKWRFVGYIGGSMLAWTAAGLLLAAGIGRLIGLLG